MVGQIWQNVKVFQYYSMPALLNQDLMSSEFVVNLCITARRATWLLHLWWTLLHFLTCALVLLHDDLGFCSVWLLSAEFRKSGLHTVIWREPGGSSRAMWRWWNLQLKPFKTEWTGRQERSLRHHLVSLGLKFPRLTEHWEMLSDSDPLGGIS